MEGTSRSPAREQGLIGPVNTARRGALVYEVPPAEEPVEGTAKESQCVRYHRSQKREESATRATTERG